jgi:CheY-like chemotaxis protein
MGIMGDPQASEPSTPEKKNSAASATFTSSEALETAAFIGGEADVEQGMETAPKGNGERVLLVDDDILVVENTKRVLEQLGYCVIACTSSTDALSLIHATSEQLNCVLSDLAMPGFSGLQLATTCRLCRPGVPFLLMSGNAYTPPAESLRALRIHEFILKPFSVRLLAEALHRAMSAGEI